MRTIGHFIGGREVKGTSGRFADVFEPMTGSVQAQVALASKAELRAAVENARAVQPEWGATNPQLFHDVVRAGNKGFTAAPGWDFASGFGSLDVGAFADFVATHDGF